MLAITDCNVMACLKGEEDINKIEIDIWRVLGLYS